MDVVSWYLTIRVEKPEEKIPKILPILAGVAIIGLIMMRD